MSSNHILSVKVPERKGLLSWFSPAIAIVIVLAAATIASTVYYEMTPKKETISYMFINLIGNTQEYNAGKI